MPRYLFTCDLHCKNKPEWKAKYYGMLLREISLQALHNGCSKVVCAGDVWDEKHGVNSEVLNMIYSELKRSKARGVPWVLLRGNHEIGLKSNPHSTLLNLFQGVAQVVTKPATLTEGNCTLYLLPWYLGDQFKTLAAGMAQQAAIGTSRVKILVGHVGINEGQVSPSNCYRVPQKVYLADLQPHRYNLVFLGDYHLTQHLGDRTMYGGSPIPHGFGDAHDQGVWVLDTDSGNLKADNIKLDGKYLRYQTVRLGPDDSLPAEPGPHTCLRIQAHINLAPRLKSWLGKDRVQIEWWGQKTIDESHRRLEKIDSKDPIAVFRSLLDSKKITDPLYIELGEHAIKRARNEVYGK